MKELKNVIGSKEAAEELIIGKDTVYIHTNIRKLEPEEDDLKKGGDLYVYDEVQMSLQEYLEYMEKERKTAEAALAMDQAKAITELTTMMVTMGGMK